MTLYAKPPHSRVLLYRSASGAFVRVALSEGGLCIPFHIIEIERERAIA